MQTSESIGDLAGALALAQGEIEAAVKDRVNPAFKSKYADLTSVWDACRPALKKNNLSVIQEVTASLDTVSVLTRILHKSGQWLDCGPVSIPLTKKDAQGVGSAVTYAKRYGLSAALGVVADDDDDGHAASQRPTNTNAPAQPAEPQKIKNAPGVSEARTWQTEHLRDLNSAEGPTDFMEKVAAARTRWVKICGVYPNLFDGPENSGLFGEASKVATILLCRPEFDDFVKEVRAAAQELKQPQAAE